MGAIKQKMIEQSYTKEVSLTIEEFAEIVGRSCPECARGIIEFADRWYQCPNCVERERFGGGVL